VLVISYASRELADCCTKLEIAQLWLGPTNAQALIDLIADVEALENAQALIDFYDAKLHEGDSLSVAFSPQWRAVLAAAGPKIVRTTAGEPVWERVRRLMLVEVQEY
jgi:hypothetical protein